MSESKRVPKIDILAELSAQSGSGGKCKTCRTPEVRETLDAWIDRAVSVGRQHELTATFLAKMVRKHLGVVLDRCAVKRHYENHDPERWEHIRPRG